MNDHYRGRRDREQGFPDPGTVPFRPISASDWEDAKSWLFKLLKPGPMHQFEIKTLAETAGISDTLLKRAKKALGVISENWNVHNKHAKFCVWFWRLPPDLLLDNVPPRNASPRSARHNDGRPPWED